MNTSFFRFSIRALLPIFILQAISVASYGSEETAAESHTINDPDVPIGEMVLLLRPLTKEQLLVEAEAWQGHLQQSAEEIAKAEIAVKRQNTEIAKAKEIQEAADETKKKLETAKEKLAEAKESGDTKAMEEAQKATVEAQEGIQKVSQAVTEAAEAADKTAEVQQQMSEETKKDLTEAEGAVNTAQEALDKVKEVVSEQGDKSGDELKEAVKEAQEASDTAQVATEVVEKKVEESLKNMETVDTTAAVMDEAQEAKKTEKVELLEKITELREERTMIIDRFNAVLEALEVKTDPDDSGTLAKIQEYRNYIAAVGGIDLNIEDVTSTWIAVKGWLTSKEGGVRVGKNIGSFFGILLLAWIVSRIASYIFHRFISSFGKTSKLLEDFLVKAVRWVILGLGFIWALTALEISIGPLFAVIGAAGFIIAFALQDSLGNFASGLMILGFKPYDVGDIVDAGGASGKVTSMNLVSTTIKTFDNRQMIVPNNKIWHDVIINVTADKVRRVDLEFGIGYGDDVDFTQTVLHDIVKNHPKVLADPAPTIKLHSLGDSSVNFICRPWVNTVDYWDVYWDITNTVKKRFDSEGISIPFPQRDVHVFMETAKTEIKEEK